MLPAHAAERRSPTVPEEPDDEERALIERLSRGDDSALEPLLVRHLPGLRAFVRARAGKLIRNREDNSDVVQSICREILDHKDRFQVPADNGFKRWLYLTALRKLQNRQEYWLTQKRDVGREAMHLDGSQGDEALLDGYASIASPSSELMAREAVERIEAAMDALPEEYREVLTLARMVGLSRAEIGEIMGKKEGAVRMLLFRAQAKLAELLD